MRRSRPATRTRSASIRTRTRRRSAQAVEELFNVKVLRVNVCMVQSKPKRRGLYRGRRPGWKKAIVQLRPGDSIEIFEGVHA